MISQILDTLEKINIWIGRAVSYLILVIMGITLVEVLMRYGFNSPTIWVHETSQQLFAVAFLLGGAYTLARDGHVRVDIFTRRLSPRGQAVMEIVSAFFFFIFSGLLLYLSAEMGWESILMLERTQTPWEPYIFHIIAMIPAAAFLLVIQGIVQLLRNIQILTQGGGT